MALSHPAMLSSSPPCRSFGHGSALEERCRALDLRGGHHALASKGICRIPKGLSPAAAFPSGRRKLLGRARLKLVEAPPALEKGQIRSSVEIPVTCYQILGISEKAEKDEIVKAAMELRNSQIEDGYTADVIVSRQDLLVDVRDKILFEPQYAGDVKEKVPPKSSLRIPWTCLPAVLCLLQEVGEEKLVLEIGRAALQLPDVKPYVHDVLLSMALAECSIAKNGLEKGKVSEGFEALARAQYLLRSKLSLGKMALLSQIEESLEELAPACTLELLGIPHTPDNAERRRGAIAALRELLRQGLDAEASCRVQDWPCFLSQAMNKLLATEIVDLLSWGNLAITRKTKKSLESQNQRVVIDFSCFYVAMIAHIALGFSTRQIDMISKAKTICECLIASEGMEFLKFEEAFCSLLLGQGGEAVAVEKLQQLEVNGTSALRSSVSTTPNKEHNDKGTMNRSLESWLKDAVLSVFPDTRDCPPSLADFFRGPRQIGSKPKIGPMKPVPSISIRSPSSRLSPDHGASSKQLHVSSSRHLGEAVKQLSPANLQSPLTGGKSNGTDGAPSTQLKKNLGLHHTKILEIWNVTGDMAGMILYALVVGCFMFGTFKLLRLRLGHTGIRHKWDSSHMKMSSDTLAWTTERSSGSKVEKNLPSRLGELWAMFRQHLKHPTDAAALQSAWPSGDRSATACKVLHKRQMDMDEAEALVKQWQDMKAKALGPNHQIQTLSEVLDESMLSKWQDLANSAKARSCFWKFVLLQLSVLHADIFWDEAGNEMAEIVASLEEAAELVDESQLKKPSYYSTYKVQYVLKRQDDGSWRFCGGGIESPV